MATQRTALVTGFPGFIASRLVPGLLEAEQDLEVLCLAETESEFHAREEARRRWSYDVHEEAMRAVLGVVDPGMPATPTRS